MEGWGPGHLAVRGGACCGKPGRGGELRGVFSGLEARSRVLRAQTPSSEGCRRLGTWTSTSEGRESWGLDSWVRGTMRLGTWTPGPGMRG